MWLDDLIGVFAPQTALKRTWARTVMQSVKRQYEGAKTGRRTDGWKATGTSANTEIHAANARLRNRARDLVRNNPYAAKAVEVFVSNSIGTGILPQARTGNPKLDIQVMKAWKDWSAQCDADGQSDFYGLEALIARSVYESGECFVRFRDRRTEDGLAVPLQLQVLEADYLDTTRFQSANNGNTIIQGIEFDRLGRRVAYWLWQQHPGDIAQISNSSFQSVRVPADQVLHIYRKERPGQIRGVTAFAPILVKMRDLDEYDEAELVRKKIEACFAAFVTQTSGTDGPLLAPSSTNEAGRRVESFEPGMIEYLRPGEDVTFGNPSSGGAFPEYARTQLHAIAAGLKITYEQLTGDLSQVNYSSLRGGLLEFRRMIEAIRWQVFVPMLCIPVWNRFIDRAYVAGTIKSSHYGVEWSAPKFEMIDPLKDAMADNVMIRNGTMTLKEAIARQGYDPEQQLNTIANTNAQLDELGIILDCDPRKTAKNGNGQPFTEQPQSGENP